MTFEDHGFGDCILPVVIEKGNQKGQSSAAKYKEGDVVSKKDVCHLYINPDEVVMLKLDPQPTRELGIYLPPTP